MIDAPQRKQPRFPAYKENNVREEIKKYLKQEIESTNEELKGIAGGACGGDILFHELCIDLEIFSELYLALPVKILKKPRYLFAGLEWEKRFESLIKKKTCANFTRRNRK